MLPGPGLLLVLGGLLVLSTEFPAVDRYIDPIQHRAMHAAEQSVSSPLRLAGSMLAGLGADRRGRGVGAGQDAAAGRLADRFQPDPVRAGAARDAGLQLLAGARKARLLGPPMTAQAAIGSGWSPASNSWGTCSKRQPSPSRVNVQTMS